MDYYLKIGCANTEKSEPRFSPFRPKTLSTHALEIPRAKVIKWLDWSRDPSSFPSRSSFDSTLSDQDLTRALQEIRYVLRMSDPLPEIRSTSVSRRDSDQRIRIRFRVCNISRVRLEFTRYVTRGKIPFDSIRNGPLIYIYIYIMLRDSKYVKRKGKILE